MSILITILIVAFYAAAFGIVISLAINAARCDREKGRQP